MTPKNICISRGYPKNYFKTHCEVLYIVTGTVKFTVESITVNIKGSDTDRNTLRNRIPFLKYRVMR